MESQKALAHLQSGSPHILQGLWGQEVPLDHANQPVSCPDKSLPTPLETLSHTALSQCLHTFREIDTVSTPCVSRQSHQVPDTLRPSPDLITTPSPSSCKPRAGETVPLTNTCAHPPQHGAGVQTAALICRRVEYSL